MTELGIGVGVETASTLSRLDTNCSCDFSFWASTYVEIGVPEDYSDIAGESDIAELVSYAAGQVGILLPNEREYLIPYLLNSSKNPISLEKAFATRGTLLVGKNDMAIAMGLRDAIVNVNGRYFLQKLNSIDLQKYDYGLFIRGVGYIGDGLVL